MAKTNQRKISELNDMFIYQSGKNYVYCGPFSNKAYILTNENAREYAVFSARYFIAISVLILLALTTTKVVLSIVVGVATFVVLEVLFRTKFLANLPVVENFVKPEKANIIEGLAGKYSKNRLIAVVVMCLALVVLIPIYAKLQNYQGAMLYLNYVVTAGVGIFTLLVIIALIKKNK